MGHLLRVSLRGINIAASVNVSDVSAFLIAFERCDGIISRFTSIVTFAILLISPLQFYSYLCLFAQVFPSMFCRVGEILRHATHQLLKIYVNYVGYDDMNSSAFCTQLVSWRAVSKCVSICTV